MSRWFRSPGILLVSTLAMGLLLLGGCGFGSGEPSSEDKTPVTRSMFGEVTVRVRLRGSPPEQRTRDLSKYPECGDDERTMGSPVVSENGGVRDAVVTVEEGPPGFEKLGVVQPGGGGRKVTIDQTGCRYDPKVSAAKVGQTLAVQDSDPGRHTLRAVKGDDVVFRYTTFEGDSFQERLSGPGIYRLQCEVHPWMRGAVYVTKHGRASVTGEEGSATLTDLPPGRYVLRVWHEQLGTQSRQFRLDREQEAAVTVEYSRSDETNR